MRQPALPRRVVSSPAASRGAVFTRPEVVALLLDALGYTSDQPLWTYRLLEPSLGEGSFFLAALERLLVAFRQWVTTPEGLLQPERWVALLQPCLRGIELHRESIEHTRAALLTRLETFGLGTEQARRLASAWLHEGDFLLTPLKGSYTHIAGNPPYVRLERLNARLREQYRRRYRTLTHRADLYVAFLERGLTLLDPGGQLGFVLPDRWLTNAYGAEIRALANRKAGLTLAIALDELPAFHARVSAHTGIYLFQEGFRGTPALVRAQSLTPEALLPLRARLPHIRALPEQEAEPVTPLREPRAPLLLGALEPRALIRRLEERWPLLEQAGCRVGIGVATGADRVFIGKLEALPVEDEVKLPLATTQAVRGGTLVWDGQGIVCPFDGEGRLVELEGFPRLRAYLEAHEATLRQRYVARKSPARWYATIDRIVPALAWQPKLLLPDIGGWAEVVYDPGTVYPHHNLYYVTTDGWSLRALQTILRARVTLLFVSAYSTRLRGGYLRFQAQVLRRVRLPAPAQVSPALMQALEEAALLAETDPIAGAEAGEEAVARLYDLTPADRQVILEGTRALQNAEKRSIA